MNIIRTFLVADGFSRRCGYLLFASLLAIASGCFRSDQTSATPQSSVASNASLPKLTNLYQVGPKVDLLKLIDPQRDAIRGDFRFEQGTLVFSGAQATQLNFDVDLPEQYELLMAVAREAGNESLNIGIHVGGATTLVVIEGWGRGISGLNRVDGRLGEDNVTSSTFPVFDDHSRKMIRVIVRRESVLVDVDGGVFIDYRGPPSRLSFDNRYFQPPAPGQLLIGGWDSTFRVSSWVLTPLGEEPVKYAADPSAGDPKADPSSADTVTDDGGRTPVPGPDQSSPAIADSSKAVADSSPAIADSSPAVADSSVGMADSDSRGTSDPPLVDPPETVRMNSEPMEGLSNSEPDDSDWKPVPWRAKIDRSPDWNPVAIDKTISVSVRRGMALLPNGQSRFFAMGQPDDNTVTWSVYDLRKGQSVGQDLRLDATRGIYQLSESGEYLLSHVGVAHSRRIEIHSFVTGELVYSGESPDDFPWDHRRDLLTSRRGLVSFRPGEENLQISRLDLKTGEANSRWDTEIPLRSHQSVCVTPGGRYVVVSASRTLFVYDLVTAELVGKLPFPGGMEAVMAMAFSPDASELALIGEHDDRPTPVFWCIDWAQGRTRLQSDVTAELRSLSNTYHLGPALEWFPGGELLLFYGGDVIDRQTGRFCYRIPTNMHWQMPRRAVADDTILAMMPTDDIDVTEYRTVKIDRRGLDQSLEVIRAGAHASDIGLPPLTVVDATSQQKLEMIDNSGTPNVDVVPLPEFPTASVDLPMRLLRTGQSETRLRRIRFSSPESAVAIAHFQIEPPRDGDPQQTMVRYDLRRGKSTSSIPVRDDVRLADVSPDSNRVLLGLANEVHAFMRLDVVDMTGKSHVAGWRPFAAEPYKKDVAVSGQPAAMNPQSVSWARFVDGNRVLTINPEGTLVCWSLPECVAIYSCNGFLPPYKLTTDRHYLAGTDGRRIHLIDVRNGTWAGRLEASQEPLDILRVGIHPNGGELVAALGYQGRREFVFWDLRSGEIVEKFEPNYSSISGGGNPYAHPMHRETGLEYRRDGYLLLDDLYLVDRKNRTTPWLYGLRRGVHVSGDADGREWYAQHVSTTADQGGQAFDWILTASEVPSDEVLSLMRQANPQPNERPAGRSILSLEGEQATLEGN